MNGVTEKDVVEPPAGGGDRVTAAFAALRHDVEQFDRHEPLGDSGLFSDKVPPFMKSYLVNWLRRFMAEHGDAVLAALSGGVSPPVSAAPPNDEAPLGAILNGREFLRRLADHYAFECEGGTLANCYEYAEAVRCFEHMAEWISSHQAVSAAPQSVGCFECGTTLIGPICPKCNAQAAVEAARAEEREACAKVAEDFGCARGDFGPDDWSDQTLSRQGEIAAAIRALGKGGAGDG